MSTVQPSEQRPSEPSQGFPGITVAALQMEPRVGCKADNLQASLRLIDEAATAGARIVVLPELVSSGYVFSSREEAFELAEPVPGGASTQAWEDIARQRDIYLIAGVAERLGNKLYNSAVMVGPEGYIGTYRKLHLWGDEHLYFEAGDLGLPVFHTPLGRLAMIICYDGWFPEVYRLLAMQGADIVCMPTNWVPMPGQRDDAMIMANTLAMANAHSNSLNIICADRVGIERGQRFVGNSLIVGADGWPLAAPGSADREEILYAEINLKASRQSRHLTPFNTVLRDRRSDLYDPMLGTGWQLPRY
ncbi:nitrilase family protein [Pseudomonas gingeri]|uniref:Hydratase n=1 Tax=Pseudomonas gingeri TaxID=117681 RepID=A0A7Y8CJD9_9PSED|nr:nitrilase family protein [Pseudomonas gingeri]NVZ99103.1 hydratase [Pseudomonas gingeri]NWA13148.1 hydratase [Pseudomonas gingeri]NWA55409.1 hydratase [Pseudomonas gingeri]NWA95737.1 hydratase [Pseudomonas gingeri]NWB00825.1 hydratase [Pseudomonas gingeri]